MRARIPAMARQIDAAAERQLIVDNDDLLMMASADGMVIVEPESHAARHPPSQPPARERIAFERVERAVVPRQDVTPKVRASPRDIRQQLIEPRRRLRFVWRLRARQQIGVGGDVPAQAEHALARVEQRPPDKTEIVGGVLNAVKPRRAVDAPAVPARLDDHSAGLNRRKAWLIATASVNGTTMNSASMSAGNAYQA